MSAVSENNDDMPALENAQGVPQQANITSANIAQSSEHGLNHPPGLPQGQVHVILPPAHPSSQIAAHQPADMLGNGDGSEGNGGTPPFTLPPSVPPVLVQLLNDLNILGSLAFSVAFHVADATVNPLNSGPPYPATEPAQSGHEGNLLGDDSDDQMPEPEVAVLPNSPPLHWMAAVVVGFPIETLSNITTQIAVPSLGSQVDVPAAAGSLASPLGPASASSNTWHAEVASTSPPYHFVFPPNLPQTDLPDITPNATQGSLPAPSPAMGPLQSMAGMIANFNQTSTQTGGVYNQSQSTLAIQLFLLSPSNGTAGVPPTANSTTNAPPSPITGPTPDLDSPNESEPASNLFSGPIPQQLYNSVVAAIMSILGAALTPLLNSPADADGFLDSTNPHARRPQFDIAAFVNTLEQVDISTIPDEDMKCPHCWLPFGTTDEDDPTFVYAPDSETPPELSARLVALRELPFCQSRANNDPVKTPCGHIFGRGCLIETMEKVDTLCPTCRQQLGPEPETESDEEHDSDDDSDEDDDSDGDENDTDDDDNEDESGDDDEDDDDDGDEDSDWEDVEDEPSHPTCSKCGGPKFTFDELIKWAEESGQGF